jgi:hypothetical protein
VSKKSNENKIYQGGYFMDSLLIFLEISLVIIVLIVTLESFIIAYLMSLLFRKRRRINNRFENIENFDDNELYFNSNRYNQF